MTRKRLKVILDLDQTLISAESTTKFDFAQNSEKASRFNFHDMNGYYIVFERPEYWLIVDREELFKFTWSKLEENNFRKGKNIYEVYQRDGRLDKITMVPFKDIEQLTNVKRINKND